MSNNRIDEVFSKRIKWARHPTSYQGAAIIQAEATNILMQLKAEGFSPEEIRTAIDRAVAKAILSEVEAKVFRDQADLRFGRSTALGIAALAVSEAQYLQSLKMVTNKLGTDPKPGFALDKSHKFNTSLWKRMPQPDEPNLPRGIRTHMLSGCFEAAPGIYPSAALQDILDHPNEYAYDCATGAIVAQYLAMLKMMNISEFDRRFRQMLVGPWAFDPEMQRILERQGPPNRDQPGNEVNFKLGDIVYFKNPGVSLEDMELGWEGENAIYLGAGKYYAHPLGIKRAEEILTKLASKCPPVLDPAIPNLAPYLVAPFYRPNITLLKFAP